VPEFPDSAPVDTTLLQELQDVDVWRTKYLFQARWPSLRHDKDRRQDFYGSKYERIFDMAFVPKGFLRWFPYAIRDGRKLANSVDLILTMNNPITLHLIGYILHKWSGKPWIVEIRDPIVKYAYGRRGPEWFNYRVEHFIFKNADAIIQRKDGTPGNISKRYPDLADKFHIIPYAGFDEDDFVKIQDTPEIYSEKLLITYTGSLYGDTITPLPFLRGVNRFLQESPACRNHVKIIFAGDWDPQYDEVVKNLNLQEVVSYQGRLTRSECIQLWQNSQILLLILGKESDNLLRIPSKFWDYVGARRPILSLVDVEGRLANLIIEQNLGVVADPEDEKDISNALGLLFERYKQGKLSVQTTTEFLSKSSRAASEKMVIDIFDQILLETRPARGYLQRE
jgi:hypothetical protein